LFCFPYAGGSSLGFRSWPDQLLPDVEVCIVQLPGRGPRIREAGFTELDPLVDAIGQALLPRMDRPFVFFGHSMGAMIGFELARYLRRQGRRLPRHLFVSGRRAPQIIDPSPHTYDLPEAEFIKELRRLNGTPTEVLEHADLMSLMMPILRTDFAVCQTYEYKPGPPLDCPISAYGGVQDPQVPKDYLEGWKEQTSALFTLKMFPGDHFFIHSDQALLLRALSQEISQYANEKYWGESRVGGNSATAL
jgi:medium-chain acyl-[acyl-carrier-protein] hydrolase